MGSDIEYNGEARAAAANKESSYGLSTVPTSVTLSPEQFERLYLSPMMHRQGSLAKQVGNPTPLYVFSCALFGWIPANNIQGLRRIRYHYNSPLVLFDGLERCHWKWNCVHVRIRTQMVVAKYQSKKAVALLPSLGACCW